MTTRSARKLETEVALRRAAVQLMTERGYDGTSTDDIARAAGVSPRTFFNYFPTKESVVLLPEQLLSDVTAEALRERPLGEDVTASLAAAAVDTVERIFGLAEPAGTSLLVASLQLTFSERSVRAIFLERRAATEDVAWAVLLERGVAATDLGARAAVTTVIALTYLGLKQWAEGAGAEPAVAVVARCLLLAPEPARFAAGVTARPAATKSR
jgi:AcrR family transcriptional regulator